MKIEKHTVSMRLILSILLAITLAATLTVTFYTSRVADESLRKQAAEINLTTLSYYVDSLDTMLSDTDRYLYNFITGDSNVTMLNIDSTETERYFAKSSISSELSKIASLHNVLNGVIFYSPSGPESEFITKTTAVLSLHESNVLREHIIKVINQFQDKHKLDSSRWFLNTIDGRYYFLRIIYSNGAYCGAWVSIDSLKRSVSEINFGENSVSMICSSYGNVLGSTSDIPESGITFSNGWKSYDSSDGKKYIQICDESSVGDFKVAAMIPMDTITKDFDHGLETIKSLNIVIFIIPLIMFVCIIMIYRPLSSLVSSMKKVGSGDMDVQIKKKSRLSEFYVVDGIFNSMVSEIKHLKISIYEQKLNEQKIKRQYLQMQLKSHFFLNCLNIIYSLSAVKDYKLIQELTLCLVKYFRYISRDSSKAVTIQSELEHILNYMEIQKLRFPDIVSYKTDIDPQLYDFEIPTLMIQTFMENSIEHAIDFERQNIIKLTVKKQVLGDEHGVNIKIEDNGRGFSPEVLEQLNNSEHLIKKDSEKGIGINNIKNRLQLMYHDKAVIKFYNSEPEGAVVDIWLPDKDQKYFKEGS